ncbi:DUF3426 domain-containing protein [Desulfothermus sp.]
MIISCPKCNTKYRVKDELLNPDGTKLKCSRCKHIFTFYPEKEDEKEIDGEAKKSIDKEKQIKTEEKIKLSLEEPTIDEKSSKKIRNIVIGVVVVILISGIIWYFYPTISKKIPFLSHKKELKQISHNATKVESVKKINLEDIKQYFVDNEKIGKILVIEGRAVNKFEKPKELIKVKATLYDSNGKQIAQKTILCGNKLSLFQLQSWTKDHLEKELNSKVGVLMKNTNLQPGAGVDFMVLFYNPPENVSEYGLEVVQALDVEEKNK